MGVSHIQADEVWVGPQSPQAHWGWRFASETAHPRGLRVDAGYGQEDSVAHPRDLSIGLLAWPRDVVSGFHQREIQKKARLQLQCLCMTQSLKSHSAISGISSCLHRPALFSMGGDCARVCSPGGENHQGHVRVGLSQILTDVRSKFKSGYYRHPQGHPLLSKKNKVGSYK